MADNYLENKMAEHMARKGSGNTRCRSHAPSGPRLGLCRVLIAGDIDPVISAVAQTLSAAGARVALIGSPIEGIRSYPAAQGAAAAVRHLFHDWHEVDILIVAGHDSSGAAGAIEAARTEIPEVLRSQRARTISINSEPGAGFSITAADPAAQAAGIAAACLFLCSDASRPISEATIRL
ncbi:MAG: hypothetical protein JFR38_05265 [Muribaculaceae bacterium]|mgnify:CR=1 FL=1|nr:hypothetical protein [Muribaculaceae bacterium]